MLATVHALVGGAIAAKIGNPVLAPVLSLGSHFLLDSVPHWDFGTNWKNRSKQLTGIMAITDTVVGFAAAWYMFSARVPALHLLLGIAAAELPDWIEAPWYIFFASASDTVKKQSPVAEILHAFYVFQNNFHTRAGLPLGIITQIAAVAFFLLLLK